MIGDTSYPANRSSPETACESDSIATTNRTTTATWSSKKLDRNRGLPRFTPKTSNTKATTIVPPTIRKTCGHGQSGSVSRRL